MKIDGWVVREVIDTLHMANITLLGITGLDSEQEFAKKCVENETAINRRIYKAISLLKSSVKEEIDMDTSCEKYLEEKALLEAKKVLGGVDMDCYMKNLRDDSPDKEDAEELQKAVESLRKAMEE